ncbi:MAG: antitoxin [Acidimicrobiales bacterium]
MPDEQNEGIMDKVKDAAGKVTDKVKDLFTEHGDKVDDAVDKTGDFVDDKTGGKFSEHIDKGKDAAHDAVDKLSGEGDEGGGATK